MRGASVSAEVSPSHQEDAEAREQEGNEHPDPHLHGEGRQEAQGVLLMGHVLMQEEAQPRLHERRAHIHHPLSIRRDSQWSHSQVSFLEGQKDQKLGIKMRETRRGH